MENISLILSVLATALGLVSMYFSKFKVGKLLVLPVRLYRLIGWTSGDNRIMQLTLPLTFVNTGTSFRSIHDLRIRVALPEKKESLILEWLEERDHLSSMNEREEKRTFPVAPVLNAYESKNRIYTFQSRSHATELVKSMETTEEERAFPCFLEYRNIGENWKQLLKFQIHYCGRQKTEMDFDKING
ncbi:MAG: hypothetical protein HUU50_07870 [Candidatus Brocadiae bacterium]|nr:hypothetical protein [Candidatus Brocadiia bacterium]